MARIAIERFYIYGETDDPIDALNMFMAILMKSVENAREDYDGKRNKYYQTKEMSEILTHY